MDRDCDNMELRGETEKTTSGCTRSLCAFHRMFVTQSFSHVLGVVIIYLSVFSNLVEAYNLDLETLTVHSGSTESMFGYTVAFHQDQGSKW